MSTDAKAAIVGPEPADIEGIYRDRAVARDRLAETRHPVSVVEYDAFVRRQWLGDDSDQSLAVAALGLGGEAGEAQEKIKKHLRGDYDLRQLAGSEKRIALLKELGDVAFYVARVAQICGYSFADVLDGNVAKLTARREKNGTLRGDGDDR